MRPVILNPLFASLSSLPGIGPKLEKLYARLLGRDGEPSRIIDLLFHLPTGFVDRRNQPTLIGGCVMPYYMSNRSYPSYQSYGKAIILRP